MNSTNNPPTTRTEVTDLIIQRRTGVAGQISYRARYVLHGTDPDNTQWTNTGDVTFVGFHDKHSTTPGPVVMVSESPAPGYQIFVTDPQRFGRFFNREWVTRFVHGSQT